MLPRLVPLERELPLRVEADFDVPDERVDPAPEALAREDAGLVPPEADLEAVLRGFDAALRVDDAPDLAARPEVPERLAPDDELRAPLDRAEPLLPPDEPELALPLSPDHLPVITRCAASATASAMIEPSFVALESMLPAARSAVSAASSPASRIFLRAAGLALIAAAAAARPAASISLLIAALASLSTELSLEPERDDVDFADVDREELFRADLAMFPSPSVIRERHFRAVPVP